MTEQNFTAWLADNKAELKDIIGAARAGFAGGYASALEQIGAGGVGDVSPVRAEPPQTEERAAFEAEMFHSERKPARDESGNYVSRTVQWLWEGWQARAALSSRPVQGGISGWSIERASDDRIRVKAPDGMAWSFIDADDVGGCNQFVYRLLSALLSSAPAREQWQPIETAPKDGTLLLLWEEHEDEPFIGRWYEHSALWEASTTHYDTDGNACVIDRVWSESVTHWMPLHAAPSHGICKE